MRGSPCVCVVCFVVCVTGRLVMCVRLVSCLRVWFVGLHVRLCVGLVVGCWCVWLFVWLCAGLRACV